MFRSFLSSRKFLQNTNSINILTSDIVKSSLIFFRSMSTETIVDKSKGVDTPPSGDVANNAVNFETLQIAVPKPFVYHVKLQRPTKYNALNKIMWIEIGKCFNELADNSDCRVIILSGLGKHFCTGIDLNDMAHIGSELAQYDDVARRCKILKHMIHLYQDSLTSLEKCPKPVIGAIHGACVGGGVDLIAATDIRFCTTDAWFQIKEVDIGMAADVGTLQRLPHLIGSASLVNELAFTARKLPSSEAKECGLVSKVFPDIDSMLQSSIELAENIAKKSPLAVQGTKMSLIYSRDHTVQEGLDHIALWNQTMLQSEDFLNASIAQATKSPAPPFSKL